MNKNLYKGTGLLSLVLVWGVILWFGNIQPGSAVPVWSSVGGLNSYSTGIATDASKRLYVIGEHISCGGDYCLLRWDGTNSTWTLLSPAPISGGLVETIEVNPISGDVYIGGDFTAIGGNINLARLAVWNASTGDWESLGGGVPNGKVNDTKLVIKYDFLQDPVLTLYVTGMFTKLNYITGGSLTARYLMAYSFNLLSWTEVGGGMNAPGNVLAVTINTGGLYGLVVGGGFTQVNLASPITVNYVAHWIFFSGDWISFTGESGTGVSGEVKALFYPGCFWPCRIYVGGSFMSAGGYISPGFAEFSTLRGYRNSTS